MGRCKSAHSPDMRRTFWCTHEPSETLVTLGESGEVAGACLGTLSLLCDGIPIKLYRLPCVLGTLGRLPNGTGGGVLFPLPLLFNPGR